MEARWNNKSLYALGKSEGINVSRGFCDHFRSHYYVYPDRRDYIFIKYFCDYGFFYQRLFPTCRFCGAANSKQHAVEECPALEEWRTHSKDILSGIGIDPNGKGLVETLNDLYFRPPVPKKIPRVLNALKVIYSVYIVWKGRKFKSTWLEDL